jgi:hypothetical protein
MPTGNGWPSSPTPILFSIVFGNYDKSCMTGMKSIQLLLRPDSLYTGGSLMPENLVWSILIPFVTPWQLGRQKLWNFFHHRITSGFVEGMNSTIRVLKRIASAGDPHYSSENRK